MADLSLAEATAAVTEADDAVPAAKKLALAVLIRELRAGRQPVELEKPHSPWTASYIRTVAYDNGIKLASGKSKSRFATPNRPPKPAEPLDPEQAAIAATLSMAEATAAVIAADERQRAAKEVATQLVVEELRQGATAPQLASPNSPWSATQMSC